MKSEQQRYILLFVSATIAVTIAVQGYWNYLNYQNNKVELTNQVRTSLDNAVESYYANIARSQTMTVTATSDTTHISQFRHIITDNPQDTLRMIQGHQAFAIGGQVGEFDLDSMIQLDTMEWRRSAGIKINRSEPLHVNTLDTSAISLFASKIFVSLNSDEIDLEEISSLITQDFDQNEWEIDFGLLVKDDFCKLPMAYCDSIRTYGIVNGDGQLAAMSQSAILPGNNKLEIHFSNISSILLKKSFFGISLSLLLSVAIIFCLLYLFRTINQQKQLAEIKNDLISNITHEFKTPITTIGTALEGIENFSGLADQEKTKKYIGMSQEQLGKLNTMVEKLLDTASMDSEHLELNMEHISITNLINLQLASYKIAHEDKTFRWESNEEVAGKYDPFHIESAISNLLDNAVKYGGDEISVLMKKYSDHVTIQVKDNGQGIAKDQYELIFDKFYRIPTGNVHDVKGFGIGLYYAKNIVEKHGGELVLVPSTEHTIFQITLPHAS